MKLKENETLVRLSDIKPEAILELEPVLAQIEEHEKDLRRVFSQLEMLKAKGEYLAKLKWSIFDTYHPETDQAAYTPPPNMNASRRYDWAEKTVALVEYPLPSNDLPEFLKDAVMEALGGRRPNKPKAPEPAPENSAETKQSTAPAASAEAVSQ